MELLKHTIFDDEENNQQNLLNVISKDIELFEKNKKENQPLAQEQPSHEELLKMLGERIATGEIKRELSSFGNYLMIENEQGILKVDLRNGKIEPEPEKEEKKREEINSNWMKKGGFHA